MNTSDKIYKIAALVIGILVIVIIASKISSVSDNDADNNDPNIVEIQRTQPTDSPVVSNNTNNNSDSKTDSVQYIDNIYGEGKSTDDLMFEEYGCTQTDSTVIRDNIEIERIDGLDEEVYTAIMLEASALADKFGYSDIELKVDEYNENTQILSYIVRFDGEVYYYIYYNLNNNSVMSKEDTNNIASDVWNNVEYTGEEVVEYIEEDVEPNMFEDSQLVDIIITEEDTEEHTEENVVDTENAEDTTNESDTSNENITSDTSDETSSNQ